MKFDEYRVQLAVAVGQARAQLRSHLDDFVAAYNFARRLKRLRGLVSYEFICKAWADDPNRFITNPHHQMPGPNSPASQQSTPHRQAAISACRAHLRLDDTLAPTRARL
jgi:hypothetical protein